MQMLPLIALLLAGDPVDAESRRVRLVWVAGASYFVLFALLLAQALRGEALAAPSQATIAAFIVWASGHGGRRLDRPRRGRAAAERRRGAGVGP